MHQLVFCTIPNSVHNNRSNHQTEDFSDANISWNFGNLTEKLEINAPFKERLLHLVRILQSIKVKMERS